MDKIHGFRPWTHKAPRKDESSPEVGSKANAANEPETTITNLFEEAQALFNIHVECRKDGDGKEVIITLPSGASFEDSDWVAHIVERGLELPQGIHLISYSGKEQDGSPFIEFKLLKFSKSGSNISSEQIALSDGLDQKIFEKVSLINSCRIISDGTKNYRLLVPKGMPSGEAISRADKIFAACGIDTFGKLKLVNQKTDGTSVYEIHGVYSKPGVVIEF